jgi:geranylgeranyl diphosphate synthase type II
MKTDILKNQIDNWLKEYFKDKGTHEKIIYEAMSYSVNIGGKRIRPILMLQTYSMYKEDYKKILPFACALEMIHTYSLIHDDLPCMDNDDLRRGKPTNHKVYGEAIAVLAGDALLNEALKIMFKESLGSGGNEIEAGFIISESASANGMIGGQVVDIISEEKEISEQVLKFMHKKKTGELIKAAVLAGAVLGGAEKHDIMYLKQYGEKLGLAFQIKDDILDVIGDAKKLGKKIKSDEGNHKTTFSSLYGLEKCKEMEVMLTGECFDALKKIEKDTSELEKITQFLLNREY